MSHHDGTWIPEYENGVVVRMRWHWYPDPEPCPAEPMYPGWRCTGDAGHRGGHEWVKARHMDPLKQEDPPKSGGLL